MPKTKWERKSCGCVKAKLPRTGRIAIRCAKHRGKPSKTRLLAYFGEETIVMRDSES